MSKEVPVVKRLSSSLNFLREHQDIKESTILSKRKEKTYFPDGYSGNAVTRKGIDDDYILLLQINNSPETIGFTINHLNRPLEEAELTIGTSYRSGLRKTLTLSEKTIGYENIRTKLNGFVKTLIDNPALHIIEVTESYFGITLTEENAKERNRAKDLYNNTNQKRTELMNNSIQLNTDMEEYRSNIPNLLKETEESKRVNELRKQLIEAERLLGEKYKELNKPLKQMEAKSDRIRQEMHSLSLELSEKAKVTNIGENLQISNISSPRPKMK